MEVVATTGLLELLAMQSSSQIITDSRGTKPVFTNDISDCDTGGFGNFSEKPLKYAMHTIYSLHITGSIAPRQQCQTSGTLSWTICGIQIYYWQRQALVENVYCFQHTSAISALGVLRRCALHIYVLLTYL